MGGRIRIGSRLHDGHIKQDTPDLQNVMTGLVVHMKNCLWQLPKPCREPHEDQPGRRAFGQVWTMSQNGINRDGSSVTVFLTLG